MDRVGCVPLHPSPRVGELRAGVFNHERCSMSITSDFTLLLQGPRDQLETIKAKILAASEPIGEGPFAEQFIFSPKPETWGDLGEGHEFLWLRELQHYRCDSVLGPPAHDELRIIGESKYSPPVVFVERLLEKFPALLVDLHATTENELYAHWQSRRSGPDDRPRLVCRHERLTDPATDTILRLAIDGHQILPRDEAGHTD